MTLQQWIMILVFSVAFLSIYKVAPILVSKIFKRQRITEEQKKMIEKIISETIKELLKLSVIKSKDELKFHCTNLVMKSLAEKGIDTFTEAEISLMINIFMNTVENNKLIEEKFSKK